MGENVVISIDNVVKRFPVGGSHFTALKNIDLTLHKGEFTGLIGPSGSGKTTLLNIIGGLDSATNGAVRVLEQSMDNTTHNERAKLRRKYMGFIFQSYNLLPVYTVFENIELPLILNKVEPKKRKTIYNIFEMFITKSSQYVTSSRNISLDPYIPKVHGMPS